ncbi:MAG: Zn-dependent hydrolase, partial [Ignavibacteria bacterium]|nr:Zn-dependent hydrolase [Ignavibacteria bacterium]
MKNTIFIILALIFAFNTMNAQDEYARQRIASYKRVEIGGDFTKLTANEKQMIPLLIEAAKIIDELFWKQNFGDKESLFSKVKDDYAKQFCMINYGPWDQLNDEKPFVEGFG